MVQSPSWEANWFAASQEIPRISRNPKVHHRTHKRQPPVSILNQPNPVHITTSHLLEIHPNIIHPYTPKSPQWSPSLRFPHQDSIHPLLLTHTRHMPSPNITKAKFKPGSKNNVSDSSMSRIILWTLLGNNWPPLRSSGQSFWLQIQRSQVRTPALPDFQSSSSRSGTGSTQPREVNWGATWMKKLAAPGLENRD